jgi:hypothetical protein
MKARGLIAVAFALAGGLGASIFLIQRQAHSADHLDSPAAAADPTGDLNDLYTWMDGTNAVFALTLYPAAPSTALFSDATQYVIHTTSTSAYGVVSNKTYDIICTFTGTTAPQTAQCWGGNNEYVTGNAGAAGGITSTDGKFKVFAGLRADPFFFNIDGFHKTVADVQAAIAGGTLTPNEAGCPTNLGASSLGLVQQLATAADGGQAVDYFASLNALAIVVSIDKSLVTTGGAVVSTWAGSYK